MQVQAGDQMTMREITIPLQERLYEWLSQETKRRGRPLPDVVTDILNEYAQEQDHAFDITKTRTWELRGSLAVAEVEERYIVGRDDAGQPLTSYSEHVDDALYGIDTTNESDTR